MTAGTFVAGLFGAAREHWVRSMLITLVVVYAVLMNVTGHASFSSHPSGPRCYSTEDCANDYQDSQP
jgi:hypothetical protein